MNGLQTRVFSLEYKARDVKANEETLTKIYEGARLGLQDAGLAYHAELTLFEFRQLEQLDPRVEAAVVAGKADAEYELASTLRAAALMGDAKTALEILKHKHGWAATQVVKNEHTGANGGPLTFAAVDLRGLSDDELQQMKKMLQKAAGEEQA